MGRLFVFRNLGTLRVGRHCFTCSQCSRAHTTSASRRPCSRISPTYTVYPQSSQITCRERHGRYNGRILHVYMWQHCNGALQNPALVIVHIGSGMQTSSTLSSSISSSISSSAVRCSWSYARSESYETYTYLGKHFSADVDSSR